MRAWLTCIGGSSGNRLVGNGPLGKLYPGKPSVKEATITYGRVFPGTLLPL